MTVSATSAVTALSGGVKNEKNNVLGSDDFFKLLVAQLQNQDPMQPMEDKEFIAQMAQFQTLEFAKTVSEKLDILLGGLEAAQQENDWFRAVALIGKTVTTANGSGMVEKVKLVDGVPYLVVGDNNWQLGELKSITNTETEQTAAAEGENSIG